MSLRVPMLHFIFSATAKFQLYFDSEIIECLYSVTMVSDHHNIELSGADEDDRQMISVAVAFLTSPVLAQVLIYSTKIFSSSPYDE